MGVWCSFAPMSLGPMCLEVAMGFVLRLTVGTVVGCVAMVVICQVFGLGIASAIPCAGLMGLVIGAAFEAFAGSEER